jgi:hypothetical protein
MSLGTILILQDLKWLETESAAVLITLMESLESIKSISHIAQSKDISK